jgi:hypothetical protein
MWKAITESELEQLVASELLECTGDQRSLFEARRVDFYRVPIRRLSGPEEVLVVAEFDDALMYYDGVEEGFELAELDKEGAILNQGCSQFELRHVMRRLQSHKAQAAGP